MTNRPARAKLGPALKSIAATEIMTKILIVDFDLFGVRGGGQTVYAKLMQLSPGREFYFFHRDGERIKQHAQNIFSIPFREHYGANDHRLPPSLGPFYYRYVRACDFAASIKSAQGPMHFDVVDVPDYTPDAMFIRPALADHGIGVGVLALAMHGTITSAMKGDWLPSAVSAETLSTNQALEFLQFQLCDARYAISQAYAEEWRTATGYSSRMVSPLHVVGAFSAESAETVCTRDPELSKPDLVFIGRRERGKGPDVFLDLAWAIDPAHFGKLRIIGGESTGVTGTPSLPILEKSLRLRKLDAEISDSLPFEELAKLFKRRTIVVLPSRRDTLNLVALEALRLGCPVFVSRQAGVSRWIEVEYPELSDLIIDLGCGREAAARVRHAAQNYDSLRARICEAIASRPIFPSREDLADMYTPVDPANAALQEEFNALAAHFQRQHPLVFPRYAGVSAPPTPSGTLGRMEAAQAAEAVADALAAPHLAAVRNYGPNLVRMLGAVPSTENELSGSIALVNEALGIHRSARAEMFALLGDLERLRGNHLTSALYDLRVIRCLGTDRSGRLDRVKRAFEADGFIREAEVIEAMYRDPETAPERCTDLIRQQFERLLTIPERPFEILDDRRGTTLPKVSVIVSLYKADSKLATLLENVSIQTLAEDGRVEVVLVDSGSPGREYQVFREVAGRFRIPVVYARSRDRETIQAAWNRGIGLSRAPYLCFYGVDEGMHPDCLEILADVLDTRPRVDWAMADSVVTDVDRCGFFEGDVMEYDRAGLDPEVVYLDTCYLSWVGGLYRRSVHERYGYYDESFRAAGDTEFKSRILHGIEVFHVPKTLGVFNNYPEERTTAHPRAEIEDQRAWYLHRTVAGMANLFERRPIDAAEALFRRCLGYRKSYCRHVSTDLDLADAVAQYMRVRGENPEFAQAANVATTTLREAVLDVERLSLRATASSREAVIRRTFEILKRHEEPLSVQFELDSRPQLHVFNDNRFEQHWWSWSTP